MFRNPRENQFVEIDERVLPFIGRPPTPPSRREIEEGSPLFTLPAKYAKEQAKARRAAKQKSPTPMSRTPVLGRQSASKIPASAKKTIPNTQSILNFFGKAPDKPEGSNVDEQPEPNLFFKDVAEVGRKAKTLPSDSRFNEHTTPVKRRRLDDPDDTEYIIRTPSPEPRANKSLMDEATDRFTTVPKPPKKYRGGFVDDSSDEEDDDWTAAITNATSGAPEEHVREDNTSEPSATIDTLIGSATAQVATKQSDGDAGAGEDSATDQDRSGRREVSEGDVPRLNRAATSMFEPGEFGDEDFENDEFYEQGEEFLERKWMEEQREMGMVFDDDEDSKSETESVRTPQSYVEDEVQLECATEAESVSLCPICNGSMRGLSESQASSHVNACLDGNAETLPKHEPEKLPLMKPKPLERQTSDPSSKPPGAKRFQRAAIARPAQMNPFAMTKDKQGGSAFTRLMSGHAEDAAWVEAATNEQQSRGKPAYQRTCPFYKIMPGLYICVDAFRYGKVEGQNAYFLSHFHSDHYIGLTSSWCHGPIYASKVTCNLMRQQLRVDSKWLVPLEFEKKVEVPNTKGVFVTMIPANHCPGSSLYLFEKVAGKNKDGSHKSTRILHCGDFRACPAHVAHPLLRPDVVDAITGQTKQQVIDTCYLDTTYLTPKYAFPSQHDVIDACAKMCVSLSKDIVDSNDSWEKVKAERAGSVMKKFLEQGESASASIKSEEDLEPTTDAKPKLRGRLLVVIGTYSIGKERICLGIARALNSKIYAPPAKMRICKALEDDELNALLTKNPLEAQVHMQTLMEIRAETLHDYLVTYHGHFTRVVGFRPTGWSYRPPASRFTENPAVNTVLHSEGWKTRYTMKDLIPQRGSTKESNCFGVPYSEHSSFRELTMFCCALRIGRVVPTVNVGSARSREKMKGWIEKWEVEKRKNGLYEVVVGEEGWGSGDGMLRYGV